MAPSVRAKINIAALKVRCKGKAQKKIAACYPVHMATIYTRPKLRERIKRRITAGSKGGRAGQWSARKAQMVAQAYEAAGGGYRGRRRKTQRSLKRWTKQKWRTASGKPSGETGEAYAPARTIAALKGTAAGRRKLARANRAKRRATRAGRQYAGVGLHRGKRR